MANPTARTRKPMAPRKCQHCEAAYVPTGGQQKWCKNCVWDAASRYRVVRYGSGVDQYRADLASGSRTSTCRTCGDDFTYPYVGGMDRRYCDAHVSSGVIAGRAATATKFETCADCGLPAGVLDDLGHCFRHHPPGKQASRSCEICGSAFLTVMRRPVRVCSTTCRKARRRPLSEPRSCELCETSYYATHPQQRFCKGCTTGTGARHRATRYRMSAADVESIKGKHRGLCWICREKTGTCVDHDHATGAVRGWLCRPCNGALHYLERPGWATEANAYLSAAAVGRKDIAA
jgi:hypothetical protein